jgi:hypothetical protein
MKFFAGLGLVGLMIAVFIMIFMWAKSAEQVGQQKKELEPVVQQLSGHDASGRRFEDTITFEPVTDSSGKLRSLKVTDIVADGTPAIFYGLQPGDAIVETGNFDLRDEDFSLAKAMVLENCQKFQAIKVIRDGQTITLPAPKAPGTSDNRTPLQRQLDAIPGIQR